MSVHPLVLTDDLTTLAERAVRDAGNYFEIGPVIRRVRSMLGDIPVHPTVNMEAAVDREIRAAVVRVLKRKDEFGLRRYVCYATGIGPHRWQKFESMTAPELRLAAIDYGKQERGNRRMKKLYIYAADLIDGCGATNVKAVLPAVRNLAALTKKRGA